MGHFTYAKITGTDQKDFKGESSRKGREGWMDVSMSFKSGFAVDPSAGTPKGARTRSPLTFIKEEGAASANILQAHLRAEKIAKMVIEKVRRGEDGKSEVVVSRVTLEDGYVPTYGAYPSAAADEQREDGGHPADPRHLEEFSVSYRKITYENCIAKNTVHEDWNEPNAA